MDLHDTVSEFRATSGSYFTFGKVLHFLLRGSNFCSNDGQFKNGKRYANDNLGPRGVAFSDF